MDPTANFSQEPALHFAPPPPNSGAGQHQVLPTAAQLPPPPPGAPSNLQDHDRQQWFDAPPPPPPRIEEDGQALPQINLPESGPHSLDAEKELPPPQPPRPQSATGLRGNDIPFYDPSTYAATSQQSSYNPPPPPRRQSPSLGDDDPSNPIHYTRDPHKLIAYLVPFPKPNLKGVDPFTIPERFLIYTPPPPPLSKPAEGTKEGKLHMVQRKWQEEVRSAKTNTDKITSWKGAKSKATRGISTAMSYTTNANLDFLGRVSEGNKSDSDDDRHAKDGVSEGETTKRTVGVSEMVLVYPKMMPISQEEIRTEFVNTMLRAKTKAQRDAIIATGLMPVAYGIDILATLVWPFGGLGEIDTVWAYANIRGAKTARSVTKRLSSQSTSGNHEEDKLHLSFAASQRLEVLRRYLAASCNKTDSKLFPIYSPPPTETDVLQAIGWAPHQSGGESRNWEDEQWEMTEVKEDLKLVMHKGSKEWDKWCKAFEKDPEKAMKK